MAKFGIGQAVRRVEDRRFLTGQGRYVDDISLPGQCYGVTVLSPHAHARIKRVDITKAKAAAGVLCVLTGADAVAQKLGSFTAHLMPEDFGAPKGHRTFNPCSSPTRCGSWAIASPSSSPRHWPKRAMPPRWSRWTTSRCLRWSISKMPPRKALRRCGRIARKAMSASG